MSATVDLASSYPVLGAFLTILWVFLWIVWLVVLFRVIADIVRDDSMSGGGKAAWMVFVVVLPFLGVFVYVLARGRGMGARETRHARAEKEEFDAYVRETAHGDGASDVDDLARLSEIHDRGGLSDEEFRQAKEKILH